MAESDVQNGGGAEKTLSFKAFKPELLVEAPKASDAVVFYKAAFGAEEVNRTLHPKRKAEQETPAILSAELRVSAFSFLVSDVFGDCASAWVSFSSAFFFFSFMCLFRRMEQWVYIAWVCYFLFVFRTLESRLLYFLLDYSLRRSVIKICSSWCLRNLFHTFWFRTLHVHSSCIIQ